MPQLLSLVGKALGSILRPPSSIDASERARSSGDSEGGLDGARRGRVSEGHTASEPPSLRQRSSGQGASLETLGVSTSQSADQLCGAVTRNAGAASIPPASGGHGRSSCGGAAVAAPPVVPGLANGGCSDVSSHAGSNSPPTAPQFFRASRASLCDATASAAGEALRQASVTTCKHFTRENYNNYVRWVRATRGAMKIAGQRRPRVEATARNPHPTLLLRCEHWLEVTDEQHRYGSNLRVYFDYWVAELEAAELTPPASPALMSPSPSYGHLVALAQQQQQQLLAGAIATATAAMVERASTSTAGVGAATADSGGHLVNSTQQQHQQLADRQLQQPIAASVAAGTAGTQNPDAQSLPPPLSQHQQLLPPRPLSEEQEQPWGQPGPQQAGQSQGQSSGAGHSPGPGPSRFSNDAGAAPRAAVGCPSDERSSQETQDGQQQEQQLQEQHQQELQQQQQRNRHLHGIRVHHHYHHHHHLHHTNHTHHQYTNHNHHNDYNHHQSQNRQSSHSLPAQEGGGKHEHGASQLPQQQAEAGDGDGEEGGGEGDRTPTTGEVRRSRSSRSHHGVDPDMVLYERAGSVHRCTDDDGGGSSPDGLPPGISTSGRCHDGGDEDGAGPGGGTPISPADTAADATTARPRATVRFVVGSCDPQPTLLQRRQLRQQEQQQQVQRRRSCGETDMPAARHPAAAQPRPSSDAVTITAAVVTAAAPAVAAAVQPLCGSPRRSVLCSPSRRFMLAAMIDMSPVEAEQQPEQPDQLQQQRPQEEGQEAGEGGCLAGRQLQQGGPVVGGGGAAGLAAATQGGCGAAAGDAAGGGSGGAPPATPQLREDAPFPVAALLPPPTTPAQNSCGAGGVAGNCTALRAAKLLSNRPSVGSGTSFFRWLDNGPGREVDLAHLGVSRAKLDAERVKYLTPVELLEYELDVDIETGLLRYKRSGKLLHTGPDGRGSLDEHRRPPTPPPPAVPLALLGESAAAWWGRGSAATGAAVAEPPPLAAAALPTLCAPVAVPPLPPRNPPPPATAAAGARQSFRRVAAMGTVPEGAGGDGGSACGEVPGQSSILAGPDNLVATAAAVGGRCEAAATEKVVTVAVTGGVHSGATAAAAAVASLLPDLEVRGHSASSLARLERTREACYSGKDDSGGVTPGGSGSAAGSGCSTGCGSGDGDGSSRPCCSTAAGLAAANAPGAAAALSMSAGGAVGGGEHGVFASSLAESVAAGVGILGRATDGLERFADHAASAAAKAKAAAAALTDQLKRQGGEVAAALQLHGFHHVMSMGRPAALATAAHGAGGVSTPPAAPSPTTAVASSVGGGGGGVLAAASSSMPRTPVAVPPVGGGGGVYHHEEKVAKWIYVVDPELRLFVHPKVRGRFHHSSFLRGGAVVAAGGLAARHGRLRLLTADSGHYWPREENFRWLCEHLVYVGADLSACELRSKHLQVPAATGRELMEKMGVPPPWRLSYQPASSPSGGPAALEPPAFGGGGGGADAPPSPLAEHMHLLQLQDAEAEVEEEEGGSGPETEGPPSTATKTTTMVAVAGEAAAIYS